MIVKLLRQCRECLGNRRSLRFPSWQFSALQNMHLLICRAEDKYLLMLPGFMLICLNSALCHHSKLMARALLAQSKVLSLSACRAWRLEAEHPNLSVSDSHTVNATHLARMKGEDASGGGRGVPWPCDSAEPSRWGAEHVCAAQSNTSWNLGLDYPGTFVPAPSYSHWHELVEKPSTQTTSKICCELHVTLRQQSWPYMLPFFSMSSNFPVDPFILHLSPSYYVLAVASVPHPFNWVVSM